MEISAITGPSPALKPASRKLRADPLPKHISRSFTRVSLTHRREFRLHHNINARARHSLRSDEGIVLAAHAC